MHKRSLHKSSRSTFVSSAREKLLCRTICNYGISIGSIVVYCNFWWLCVQYYSPFSWTSEVAWATSLDTVKHIRESWSSQSHCLLRFVLVAWRTERRCEQECEKEKESVRVFLGGRRNRRAAVTRRCINNWWRQVRYVKPWDGVPLVSSCLFGDSRTQRCFSRYSEVITDLATPRVSKSNLRSANAREIWTLFFCPHLYIELGSLVNSLKSVTSIHRRTSIIARLW